jgi:hypothetical protein
MKRANRLKAISTAVAELSGNLLVPQAVRLGFAALAEEVEELRARLDSLEAATFSTVEAWAVEKTKFTERADK